MSSPLLQSINPIQNEPTLKKDNIEVLYRNFNPEKSPNLRKLRIIHFNDCYNIEGQKNEPVAGAARFKTALNILRKDKHSIVLFSGDAVSPSQLSLFSKGRQMIEALNKLDIAAAAIGNHEFDMGIGRFEKLMDISTFPWVLSNVNDHKTSKPLANAHTKVVIDVGGIKVGIFALAEIDWLQSLSAVKFETLHYEPYVIAARLIANDLRKNDKCEIVIALTHMRWKNDETLAKRTSNIDIILGGHDHDYDVLKVETENKFKTCSSKFIIKSGSDFKELSFIDVEVGDKFFVKSIQKLTINSSIPEDMEVKKIVEHHLASATKKLEKKLGKTKVDLDGRHDTVRNKESNLGNLLCDILLKYVHADCAILNGGSLRSDKIHPAGDFLLRDLRDILSFDSEVTCVELTGSQLHNVLENGVAKHGEGGGRFPQVSDIFFAFDTKKPPNQRVDSRLIKVQNKYLNLNKKYRLATNTFLQNVDPVLKKCTVVVSSENIPPLFVLVESHFKISFKNEEKLAEAPIKNNENYIHLHHEKKLLRRLSCDIEVLPLMHIFQNPHKPISFKTIAHVVVKVLKQRRKRLSDHDIRTIKEHPIYKKELKNLVSKSLLFEPEVEGRSIKIENQTVADNLINERNLFDSKINSQKN